MRARERVGRCFTTREIKLRNANQIKPKITVVRKKEQNLMNWLYQLATFTDISTIVFISITRKFCTLIIRVYNTRCARSRQRYAYITT